MIEAAYLIGAWFALLLGLWVEWRLVRPKAKYNRQLWESVAFVVLFSVGWPLVAPPLIFLAVRKALS